MTSQDKRWLNISLTLDEKKALIKSAATHKRTPKQQAAVYVLAGLAQDGLPESTVHCQCPHCGGNVSLDETVIAQALGVEMPREANQ